VVRSGAIFEHFDCPVESAVVIHLAALWTLLPNSRDETAAKFRRQQNKTWVFSSFRHTKLSSHEHFASQSSPYFQCMPSDRITGVLCLRAWLAIGGKRQSPRSMYVTPSRRFVERSSRYHDKITTRGRSSLQLPPLACVETVSKLID